MILFRLEVPSDEEHQLPFISRLLILSFTCSGLLSIFVVSVYLLRVNTFPFFGSSNLSTLLTTTPGVYFRYTDF